MSQCKKLFSEKADAMNYVVSGENHFFTRAGPGDTALGREGCFDNPRVFRRRLKKKRYRAAPPVFFCTTAHVVKILDPSHSK